MKKAERETWRRLPFHTGSSSYHFALSDALIRQSPVPTLWWHSTEHPTVILGAGQSRADLDLDACARAGVRVVKRQSGGTAIFAGPGVLGLDAYLPPGHPLVVPDIVKAYEWIGQVWLAATQSLGIESRLITVEEARRNARMIGPHADAVKLACFGSMSPYEVAVGQQKLVGLAQVRRRTGVLVQSAVHMQFDANGLAQLLATDEQRSVARELADSAAGIRDFLETSTAEDVMTAVEQALRSVLPVDIHPGTWTQEELRHAAAKDTSQHDLPLD